MTYMIERIIFVDAKRWASGLNRGFAYSYRKTAFSRVFTIKISEAFKGIFAALTILISYISTISEAPVGLCGSLLIEQAIDSLNS